MEGQSAQWFLSRGTLQARARSAPDLIVYFGALYWRSAGTVGGGQIHTFENDTGPDGANHAENGVLLLRPSGGGESRRGWLANYSIAPTILPLFWLPVPQDMAVRALEPEAGALS